MKHGRGHFIAFAVAAALAVFVSTGAVAQTATASRNLPASYQPNVEFTVTIDLTVTGSPLGVTVAEGFPDTTWVLVSASPTPQVTEPGGVGWFFSAAQAHSQQLQYTVRPPSDATGEQTFLGTVTVVGTTFPSQISGDTAIGTGGQTDNFVVTAARMLPGSYAEGVEFDVTINVTIGATQADRYDVIEGFSAPELVEYVSASPAPTTLDTDLNEAIWTFTGSDVTNRTITYRLRPKPGATTALAFLGTVVSLKSGSQEQTRDITGNFVIPGQILPTITITIPPTATPIPTGTGEPTPTETAVETPTPSPTGTPDLEVSVLRDLPETYRVGQDVTYTLTVDIAGDNITQNAVTDHIPQGWTPVSASPDWTTYNDSQNMLVWNFGPIPPPSDRTIEVVVAPAGDSFGPKIFAGGFQYTKMVGLTPEVHAGVILGETIIQDGSISDRPGPVVITRTLPTSYTALQDVNVTLAVDVDDTAPPTIITLQEIVPTSWTLASANPPNSQFIPATGTITWNIAPGELIQDMTINYAVTPPAGEAGQRVFVGTFQYATTGLPLIGVVEGDMLIAGGVPNFAEIVAGILTELPLAPESDRNGDGATDVADVVNALLNP